MSGKCVLVGLCLMLLLICVGPALAEETTVTDNDRIAVRVTGFDQNLITYDMHVTLENKTDETLIFALKDVQVNGTDAPTLWAAEVDPGETKNSTISWFDLGDDVSANGITAVTGKIRAYSKENWTEPDIAVAEFEIYPQGGASPSPAAEETPAPEDGTMTVVDDERFGITIEDYIDGNLLYCYALDVQLTNKTETPVMVTVENVTVNGVPCDPYWASVLPEQSEKEDRIGWFADTFEEAGIETVSEIGITFEIYDNSSWDRSLLYEQTVVLTP